jgi:translation initiation factor IF-3
LIQASQLRVIDEEGRQLGVMTKGEALRAAEEAGLDLVEISPDASPPVAKIGENDLAVKLRKVTGFLEAGHKVKIGVWYKGREMAHQELGYKLATKVIDMFGDGIVVEQPPMLAGRQLSFVIRGTGKPVAPKETEE